MKIVHMFLPSVALLTISGAAFADAPKNVGG